MDKNKLSSLPDAINASASKDFTQVPNDMLRNPEISGKAKAILCILLSNKRGWHTHIESLSKLMKEGIDAIRTGIIELEEFGYILRVRYRDKETKKWIGSFWSYTDIPGQFDLKKHLELLDDEGCEAYIKDVNEPHVENPDVGFPDVDKSHVENPTLITLNNNNTKINNINNKNIKKEEGLNYIVSRSKNVKTDQSKNEEYVHLANKLKQIIHSKKNVTIDGRKINNWINSIHQLVKTDGVKIDRIENALNWYEQHHQDDYVPVIESGKSLREKFLRLEDAIERDKTPYRSSRRQAQSSGYRSDRSKLTYQQPKRID